MRNRETGLEINTSCRVGSNFGLVIHQRCSDSKISQKYRPVIVDQEVGGFDIPMNKLICVEVANLESDDSLGQDTFRFT